MKNWCLFSAIVLSLSSCEHTLLMKLEIISQYAEISSELNEQPTGGILKF